LNISLAPVHVPRPSDSDGLELRDSDSGGPGEPGLAGRADSESGPGPGAAGGRGATAAGPIRIVIAGILRVRQ
jgi:hypothetical protein